MTIARIPVLSVVLPAHNNERTLPRVLAALAASTLPRESWELIVVDDGSRDGTDVVAATHADVVVRLNGDGRGPAYARNRGVEFARGEIVVFVDADVCVHPDALEQFLAEFRVGDVVGAVFGSYDLNPPAPGFVSQYRNLLHHYHHQTNAGEAQTFWAGCGAVRRSVFIAAGMYDEWRFPRPQIEDIELGNRIHALGHRIVLQPAIQCAHLKRWTLREMVLTDLKDRGLPWARLLAAQRARFTSATLNLKMREKVCTALVAVLFLCVVGALATDSILLSRIAIGCAIVVLFLNRRLYAFFERARGFWFSVRAIPFHFLYYGLNTLSVLYGWLLHELIGGPAPDPAIEAFAEVGLKTWPPVPTKRTSRWW